MYKGIKIIIAEDNEIQRTLISKLLFDFGYDVIPADDGLEALQLVQDSNVQIVLSDYQMPNLNGIDLTREVRNLDLDHYVHIIMITGSDEDDIRREALDAGVDDFITKASITVMLQARLRAATRLIHHAMQLAERTQILKESNDRIKEDFRAAAAAQRKLLPEIRDTIQGFRISSAFVPSSFVSGDMFGCFPLSGGKLGFYTVDVSGHGVHASLMSVAIGHLITPEFFKTRVCKQKKQNPAALVADLNVRFSGQDNDEYFSMFCGVLDANSGRLDFCQAGSPSPFYVDLSGKAAQVGDGGFPVGMFPAVTYENSVLKMEYGGCLIICSDAAHEAENKNNKPFGSDRLRKIASTVPEVGVDNIPKKITQALSNWHESKNLEDDLTIVAIERTVAHDTYNVIRN